MRRVGLSQVILVVLLLVACGGDDAPEPTPTASMPTRIPFPTSAPQPTATATVVATPRPGADTAPQGTQTGDAGIDRIVSSILNRDAAMLAGFFETVAQRCTNEQGLGGPPKCSDLPGMATEGTAVQVFPTGGCHGGWAFDLNDLAGALVENKKELFAVLRFEPTVPLYGQDEPGYPYMDHLIVFVMPEAGGVPSTLSVLDGRVVASRGGCSISAAVFIEKFSGYEVILRGPAYR